MSNTKLLRGRVSQIGGYYCITNVIERRRPVLADAGPANLVIDEIRRLTQERIVDSLAWVVMPDHVHWLFRLRQDSLARSMQAFKSRTARSVNASARLAGPLWQGGYYDHRLRDDGDLIDQARYLVVNPLRKGLVARIEDYPFWWCRWISISADLT